MSSASEFVLRNCRNSAAQTFPLLVWRPLDTFRQSRMLSHGPAGCGHIAVRAPPFLMVLPCLHVHRAKKVVRGAQGDQLRWQSAAEHWALPARNLP